MDKSIDVEVFELWIEKSFDTKETLYPRLRTNYRKYILPTLLEKGVRFVEKEQKDFDELCIRPKKKVFNSLEDYKGWLENIALDTFKKYVPIFEEQLDQQSF